jgi:hypothetical protein
MVHTSHTYVFTLEDQGAVLRTLEGQVLSEFPAGGSDRRRLWAERLKAHTTPRGELIVLLGHSALTVQCQNAPYLNAGELRDTSRRMTALEGGGPSMNVSATLDQDPKAEGGHILWIAFHPRQEMDDLVEAAKEAGLRLIQASPFARALSRGLELSDLAEDHMLLAVEGEMGRLFVFHGAALVLQRSFRLPEGEEDELRLERLAQELGRIQQFMKQRQKGLNIEQLVILGLQPSEPFVDRLRGLRLKAVIGPEEIWPLLVLGLAREKKAGLNLVPQAVLEAERVRVARFMLWTASILVLGLLAGGGFLLRWSEAQRAESARRMEETLTRRKELQAQRHSVVGARVPLLRLRMAEQRQAQAIATLGRLGALLLEAPEGVVLEKVEIQQLPDAGLHHRFRVEGTALTEPAFSTGPLAIYLRRIQSQQGVQMDPLKEVQVLDRREEGNAKLDQQAVARFVLEGRAL